MGCILCDAIAIADDQALARMVVLAHRDNARLLSERVELAVTCDAQQDRIELLEGVVNRLNAKVRRYEDERT